MKIIKATKSHLPKLVDIEKECFDDNYSEKTLLADINNDMNDVFVAIVDDDVVGYINVFHIFDEANLIKIAVMEKFRRSGIATKLLNKATDHVKKLGVTKMYLEVSEKNKAGIDFYVKNQFKPTTKREKYYNDLSDAIIMWKFF